MNSNVNIPDLIGNTIADIGIHMSIPERSTSYVSDNADTNVNQDEAGRHAATDAITSMAMTMAITSK